MARSCTVRQRRFERSLLDVHLHTSLAGGPSQSRSWTSVLDARHQHFSRKGFVKTALDFQLAWNMNSLRARMSPDGFHGPEQIPTLPLPLPVTYAHTLC